MWCIGTRITTSDLCLEISDLQQVGRFFPILQFPPPIELPTPPPLDKRVIGWYCIRFFGSLFFFFLDGRIGTTRRRPLTCYKAQTNFISSSCIQYSPPNGQKIKITTLEVIGMVVVYSTTIQLRLRLGSHNYMYMYIVLVQIKNDYFTEIVCFMKIKIIIFVW